MRLSSPFKDFYDGCLGLEESESLFWRRVERECTPPRWGKTNPETTPPALQKLRRSIQAVQELRSDFAAVILIAGNRYWIGYRRVYSTSALLGLTLNQLSVKKQIVWRADKEVEGLSKYQRRSIINGELSDAQRAWTYELDCPLYLFEHEWFMNPCLRKHHVQGFAEPPQIAQEIKMWFGNRASKDDTPIKIADKDRIAQHGFDKWSFRKPPADN